MENLETSQPIRLVQIYFAYKFLSADGKKLPAYGSKRRDLAIKACMRHSLSSFPTEKLATYIKNVLCRYPKKLDVQAICQQQNNLTIGSLCDMF